jgi:S1-C subfamily serine protease
VLENTPAADAGLTAGDTITKVDSTTITSGDQLSSTIAGYDAGDSVSIGYTDAAGTSHTVTVTLIEGPAA